MLPIDPGEPVDRALFGGFPVRRRGTPRQRAARGRPRRAVNTVTRVMHGKGGFHGGRSRDSKLADRLITLRSFRPQPVGGDRPLAARPGPCTGGEVGSMGSAGLPLGNWNK